jgi:hypothetical protein
MHNRNFVINMVIDGEKAPAFNARTLTLPIPQTDNTGRIIENTRRLYSRSRSEVENEIADAIRPVNTQQKPQVSHAHDIKWPIGIKPVYDDTNTTTRQGVATSSPDGTKVEPKPKRKRVRSRRKKAQTLTSPETDSALQIKH